MSSLLEIMDKKSCGKWYAYEPVSYTHLTLPTKA